MLSTLCADLLCCAGLPLRRQDLEKLLQESDIVSLHCQLNAATHGLIGQAELALMKPSAVLINTARGHVLDKQALLEALRAGHLAGVGLDVGWDEPDDPQEELYRYACLGKAYFLTTITADPGSMVLLCKSGVSDHIPARCICCVLMSMVLLKPQLPQCTAYKLQMHAYLSFVTSTEPLTCEPCPAVPDDEHMLC